MVERPLVLFSAVCFAACTGNRTPPERAEPPLPAAEPGAAVADAPAPVPYTRAIQRIVAEGSAVGWDGLRIGMTASQVEVVVGTGLRLAGVSPDELCGYYTVEIEHAGQPLMLDFDGPEPGSSLVAVAVNLPDVPTTQIAAALKDHLRRLTYRPSPHAPDLPEAENPTPLYTLPGETWFFVHPELGVYFGAICVD